MQIISTRNTKSSRDHKEYANKVNNILTESATEKELLEESRQLTDSILFENVISNYANTNGRDKRQQKILANNYFNENYFPQVKKMMVSIIENALPFDKSAIEANHEYMQEFIESFMDDHKQAFNAEKVQSKILAECLDMIHEGVTDAFIHGEVAYEDLQEGLSTFTGLISGVVQEKLVQVIAEEKQIAATVDANESKSLFRKINSENFKQASALSESVPELPVAEQAFAESVFNYAVLETMNTLRLIDFDVMHLKKFVAK